jgi:purine-binding chemotaxis protein CheW
MTDQYASEQFVTLGLDAELFAVPVELVREILDMRQPFRIPEAPPHLAGLIDVRGQAVPLLDLRLKLGLPPRAATADTRILVLEVPSQDRRLPLGLIADRVIEVTALDAGGTEPPPEIGTRWRCDYIQAIGRRAGQFVVIFDLARLLGSDAVALLDEAGAEEGRIAA